MKKTVFLYAGVLALAAFALQWAEYRYYSKVYATEIHIGGLVLAFMAFGIWLGRVLTPQASNGAFEVNEAALTSLGITPREYAVLEALAEGQSNKQIADNLNVSPHTVKTHIAHLYDKLQVNQRVKAVQAARGLGLID